MDFTELHKPYEDNQSPSVAMQVKWLQGKGIPMDVIDKALLVVYDEVQRGKTFVAEGPLTAGGALDRYLLSVAQGMALKDAELHHKELSDFLLSMREKWNEDLRTLAKAEGKAAMIPVSKMPWWAYVIAANALLADGYLAWSIFLG